MAELVYQTWQRVTGKPWSAAAAGGFTNGTAQNNLALQARLNSGWNPYQAAAPAPAPAPAAAAPAGPSAAQTIVTDPLMAFAKQQSADAQAILDKKNAYVNSAETLPAMYARLQNEAGIPALNAQLEPIRQQTLTTEGQLSNLSGDVANLTAGQGEARRRLVEAGRQAPLVQQLSDLARAQERFAGQISGAQQAVATQMGLQGEQYNRYLSKYDDMLKVFGDSAARESSAFTAGKQAEWDKFLADTKRAEDLSDQQAAQAFDLAKMALAHQYALAETIASGSGGSDTTTKRNQDAFNTTVENIVASAGDNKKAAENGLYTYLKNGGAARATSLGLNAEDYWAIWRTLKASI